MRAGHWVVGFSLFVLAASGKPCWASDLDGPEDFAQIFRLGGAERINGVPYTLTGGSLIPDLPELDDTENPLHQNSYIWGLEWFDPAGDGPGREPALFAGTNRNLRCLLNSSGTDCPELSGDSLLPIPRYPEDAAQLWRYDPSATRGGVEGTWTKLWDSPVLDNFTGCVLEAEIPDPEENPDAEFDYLAFLTCALLDGPATPHPATVGIRNLRQCNAGTGAQMVLYAAGLGIFGDIYYLDPGSGQLVEASSEGATNTNLIDPIAELLVAGADVEALADVFGQMDLGYRGLACWDRPPQGSETEPVPLLCAAPSGSIVDPDGTTHPWVLCNENPTDQDSPWEPYSPLGFDDPDNDIGIFDMTTVTVREPGGEVMEYLCASSLDRTNGSSLFCTNGTGCAATTGDAETDGYLSHGCEWTEIIPDGAWRPARFFGDTIGSGNGREENASFFGFGPYDDDGDGIHDYLYAGAADAGGGPTADNENAELVRADLRGQIEQPLLAGPVTAAGPPPRALVDNQHFLTWQLMAGIPRVTVTTDTQTTVTPLATLTAAGMRCDEELLFSADVGPTNRSIPTGSRGCRPLSGLGIGLATNESADDNGGPAAYIWRFLQFQGDLFMGIFDGGGQGDPSGFNLYKTNSASHGVDWQIVTNDAFGWGGTSYGLRTFASNDPTPGLNDDPLPSGPWVAAPLSQPVLFIGVANPAGGSFQSGDLNGAQVYMGTTLAALRPNAAVDGTFVAIDDESCLAPDDCSPPGDGSEMLDFDGSLSAPAFEATLTDWEWFPGHDLGPCGTIGATPDGTGASYQPLKAAADPFAEYPYTLRVTDTDLFTDCLEFQAQVWGNAPPFAEVTTVPPAFHDGGGFRGHLSLVDFDGDSKVQFQLTVSCEDPESMLAACRKNFEDVGTAYFLPNSAVLADTVSAFTASVTLMDVGGAPDLDIEAIDLYADDWIGPGNPYKVVAGVEVELIPFIDTPATNDAPECESGLVVTFDDAPFVYDPNDPAPGYPRLCADPDELTDLTPAALVYEVDAAAEDNPTAVDGYLDGAATVQALGSLIPTVTYTPTAGQFGLDVFLYEAAEATDTGVGSSEVPLFVRVIDCSIVPRVVYEVIHEEHPVISTPREACIGILATESSVTSPTTFRAGERVSFGEGFSVALGGSLVVEIDPSVITDG
jgi:hypothetical protein